MFRTILLATAMTVAVPTLAQSTMTATQDVPAAAPAPSDPATPAADPATATPATGATTAAATPATSGDQVAQVVGNEFPSYDKDANGNLNQDEFAAWMVALKTASDPATKAESPETRTWVGAAFAQADKDKSRSVTQTELTGFLSQGAS